MVGAGHVSGINAVIMGAAKAANNLGWEMVGIRDGFDGLLYPELYPDGGLLTLDTKLIESLDPNAAGLLGQAPRVDPFHVRTVNEDDMVEEVDMSDELIKKLHAENIDALIAVVGGRGLTIMYKLHRKGLNVVCVPRSIENEIAGTMVSFGFNTALSTTIELLDRVRQAAQAARKIGVVEVLGEQAGWIALQAGIAVGADAVLIPEIPCNLQAVASRLQDKVTARRPYGLVVVAEGAKLRRRRQAPGEALLAQGVACRRWRRVMRVSTSSGDREKRPRPWPNGLQLQLAQETLPMVMGPWVRGGTPTAVDRQLALAYGVGALQAVQEGNYGSMVAFHSTEGGFRAAGRSDQQAQNRARRRRVREDRPLPRHLPGERAMSKQTVTSSAPTGIVLNIQRYCSHDGPGTRTNVFLKGCSLRCKWCGNPESIAFKPELSYDPRKCTGKEACGVCLKTPFPEGAFYVVEGADDTIHVNWDLAGDCDEALASLCPEGALEMFGKRNDRRRGARRGGEGRLVLPHPPGAASR